MSQNKGAERECIIKLNMNPEDGAFTRKLINNSYAINTGVLILLHMVQSMLYTIIIKKFSPPLLSLS